MVECDRCHRKFVNYAALKQHYGAQHPNAKWSEAFENELAEERKLQTYRASVHPPRGSHTKLVIAALLIVVVVGAGFIYLPSLFQTSNPACANFPFPTTANQDLAEHYHALLMIFVNGQQVQLPVNIGEGDSGSCIQPLHVHQTAPNVNVIHIESPQERTYTLADFVRVWAATPNLRGPTPVVFNQNQIFNYTVGSGYELRMYVNGQQSISYGSLTLQTHTIIVIVYGNSTTDWAHYQNLSAEPWPYSSY